MKKFFCFLKYHIDFFYRFISKLIHRSSCINEIHAQECLGATTAVEFSRGVRLLLCFLMNCLPLIVNREHFPGCMDERELNKYPQLFAAMRIATCTSFCAIWSPLGLEWAKLSLAPLCGLCLCHCETWSYPGSLNLRLPYPCPWLLFFYHKH